MSPQSPKMSRPSPTQEPSSHNAKVVLLGDTNAGKTSIVLRLVKDEFKKYHDATVGAAFSSKSIELKNHTVKLNLWDTGGQERYNSLAPMYFRNAEAAIIVYDITSADSLTKAKDWIETLLEKAPKNIIIFLAGNKLDLAMEKRAVSKENGRKLAGFQCLPFAEVSAKTGEGINDMFMTVAKAIAGQKKISGNSRGIVLADRKPNSRKCAC